MIKKHIHALALAVLAGGAIATAAPAARADTPSEPKEPGTTTTTSSADGPKSTTSTTAADLDLASRQDAEARRDMRQRGPNRVLLVGGGALFAGSYLTSAIIGAANDRDADNRLLIPVVGPWANLADRQCDERPCDQKLLSAALLVTSGVLQAGGLAAAIASFFVPESETPVPGVVSPRAAKPTVQVLPMAMGRMGDGAGLGAVGRF